MKIHEFTLQDQFNTPIETLNGYAHSAALNYNPYFEDPYVHEVKIERVEQEGLPVHEEKGIMYKYVVYGQIITKFDQRLNNLEKDCDTVLTHPTRNSDLLNMVLTEDVPELLKFARKVSEVFKRPVPEGCGEHFKGYVDAIHELEREIFGDQK